MDCPRCGAAMRQTYQPYEGWCETCHLLWDDWKGKEIVTQRTLSSYEQLFLENQRLKEALKPFADSWAEFLKHGQEEDDCDYSQEVEETLNMLWQFHQETYGEDAVYNPEFYRAAHAACDFSAIGVVKTETALIQDALTVRENGRLSFLKRVSEGDDHYHEQLSVEDAALLCKLARLVGH